ncbi:hypothetical protein SEA_BUDSKI_59 [Gordonia phage Budski]|nr:hypothetical protein SEA_BUDSKI_59 [Gordonia phage Budski]
MPKQRIATEARVDFTLDNGDGTVQREDFWFTLRDSDPRTTLREWRKVTTFVDRMILEHRPNQLDACRAGEVIDDRFTISFLPVGTVIIDASGRRCEMWGNEESADWMAGGWPTVPTLPATVVRTLHRIYRPFHDGAPDQYALEIDVYTSVDDGPIEPGPVAVADTDAATFVVDSEWLRESAATLLAAADSLDNLTKVRS